MFCGSLTQMSSRQHSIEAPRSSRKVPIAPSPHRTEEFSSSMRYILYAISLASRLGQYRPHHLFRISNPVRLLSTFDIIVLWLSECHTKKKLPQHWAIECRLNGNRMQQRGYHGRSARESVSRSRLTACYRRCEQWLKHCSVRKLYASMSA